MAHVETVTPPAGHKHRRKLEACANCGLPFSSVPDDNFCPRCGQENHELNVPAKHLLLEFLEGTLHFDTKFFRSLQLLLFKPGFLTKEFNIGHRVAFVPPIRLYVFISFIFFLLLSLQPNHRSVLVNTTRDRGAEQALTRQRGRPVFNINMDSAARQSIMKLKTEAQIDSFLLKNRSRPGFINRFALTQAVKLLDADPEAFWHNFIKRISLLMFALMPVFGLLLYLPHRSWKKNYVEFLIFSLHYHSFAFILFSGYLLTLWVGNSDAVSFLMLVTLAGYLPFAIRRVYPQPWGRVLLKSGLALALYAALLFVCLLGVLLVSFALL